jgi:hypothetical protein
VQSRHYEKLKPDEIGVHVPEKNKLHWCEKIVINDWGTELLVKHGAARDENHVKTFTAQLVRHLFDKVSLPS